MVLATVLPPSITTKSSSQLTRPPLSTPLTVSSELSLPALSPAVQSLLFSTAVAKAKAEPDSNTSLSSLVAKLCSTVLPLATPSNIAASSSNSVNATVRTSIDSQEAPIVADTKNQTIKAPLSQQDKTKSVGNIANAVTEESKDSHTNKRTRPVDINDQLASMKKQKLDEDKLEVDCTTTGQDKLEVDCTTTGQEPPVTSMEFDTGSNTSSTHATDHVTTTPFCLKLERIETQSSASKMATSHSSSPQPSLQGTESQVQSSVRPFVPNNVNMTEPSSSGTHIGLLDSKEKVTTSRKRSMSRSKKKHGASQQSGKVASTTGCSFCHKKDCELNLGFLYGPYKSKVRQETELSAGSSKRDTGSSKPDTKESSCETQSGLWVHEDCVVWAPGVCLVGGQLIGLTEAVVDAGKMVCGIS